MNIFSHPPHTGFRILANERTESDLLDRTRVRRLREDEQGRFNYSLERHHYQDGGYYPPSDSTFQRVVNAVDAVRFASLIGQWLGEQEIGALAQLAVDGKVLRGSGRHDGKPLQLLSAVTHHLRLTLDQVAIEEKSNAIPALKPLLRRIKPPPGTLISADAMHCRQESSARERTHSSQKRTPHSPLSRAERFVTQEPGGDYLWGLKGNPSGILQKAQRLLARQGFPPQGRWEKEHGRAGKNHGTPVLGQG